VLPCLYDPELLQRLVCWFESEIVYVDVPIWAPRSPYIILLNDPDVLKDIDGVELEPELMPWALMGDAWSTLKYVDEPAEAAVDEEKDTVMVLLPDGGLVR
jgi:hypothetical protein